MKTLLLIDTYSLLYRAYYAIGTRQQLTSPTGLPTGALYGINNMIESYLTKFKPDFAIACYDRSEPTFRHQMFEGYKGTRSPMPDDLKAQIPFVFSLIEAHGIMTLSCSGYEADDLLGTLSHMADAADINSIIVTGDHDCLQLVGGQTKIYLTSGSAKRPDTLIDEQSFDRLYPGLLPKQIIELKSLSGDSSDNIPGVRGIGPKTASALLLKYQTLDGVYQHIDETAKGVKTKLENAKDSAYLSHRLATICRKVPITIDFASDAKFEATDDKTHLIELYRELGFKQKYKQLTGNELSAVVPIDADNHATNAGAVIKPKSADLKLELVEDEVVFWADNSPTERIYWLVEHGLLGVAKDTHAMVIDATKAEHFWHKLKTAKRTVTYDYKDTCTQLGIAPFVFIPEDLAIAGYVLASGIKSNFETHLEHFGITSTLSDAHEDSLARQVSLFETDSSKATDLAQSQERLVAKLQKLISLDRVIQEQISSEKVSDWLARVEYPLANILLDMQNTGIMVNQEYLTELSNRFCQELSEIEASIATEAKTNINLNSPAQLSDLLYGELGLPVGKKRKGGKFATDDQELTRLAPMHHIVPQIMRYRSLSKLQSTFVEGLLRHQQTDQRIHTTYQQTTTVTGRLSSTSPNLQNIPVRDQEGRLLRGSFIAPSGSILVDADYSQIELRMLAHFSQDVNLCRAFCESIDVHTQSASTIFMVPMSEVKDWQRRIAKVVNFSIIYGVSAFSLARDLDLANYEAKEYIERTKKHFSQAFAYLEAIVKDAKRDGFVKTIGGRKRYIPELKSASYQIRSFGERAAMNAPMQGSASDLIKKAMVDVTTKLDDEQLDAKLIMQIHDELIIETSEECSSRVGTVLKVAMEEAMQLKVPLLAEVKYGKTWLEAKGE